MLTKNTLTVFLCFCSAALGLCPVPAMAVEPSEAPPSQADAIAHIPGNAEWVTASLQAKRLSNQTHRFTTVPEQIQGLPAVAPHRGPSTSEPGPGYVVTLTRPAALYLAVHHRGSPTVPDTWKPTGLTLGWGNHEDDIYVKLVEPGEIQIPAHDGKAGGYGVPHMLIVGDDLNQARQLIANPVPRRSAIHRPARVVAVLPDPNQPGLYGHPGDTIRWRLRVIPGSNPDLPTSLQVEARELDGPFVWSIDAPLDDKGFTGPLDLKPPRVGFYDLGIEASDAAGQPYELHPFLGGVGIVPEPGPVEAASPWGVMRVADAPFEARLARMLGASWVRHTNWNMVRPTDDGVDPGRFLTLAEAYREQGLHIMASISLVPAELSSRPDDTSTSGDAGPLHSRVAPRDWEQWQRFMRDTAASMGDLIDYWEIGNEPNTPHHYWAGTTDEFALLLKHAAAGIRAGDPGATILTAGFTLDPSSRPFFDRLLEQGAGDWFDILTVHSLYAKAVSVDDMRTVLEKHGLPRDTPVWSTEPKHVLPMRNFAAGVEKNMHFLLVNPGAYASFQNLAERDGAATRWGVAYALAAKHLGAARYVRTVTTGLPDVELGLFQRDGQAILAASADEGPRGSGVRVRVTASEGTTPAYVDLFGHPQEVSAEDAFLLPLDRSGVLYGCESIEVLGVEVGDHAAQSHGIEIKADEATLANGFLLKSDQARDHYAVVYRSAADVGESKPSVTFPFSVEEAGTYEFFVSAMWYPSHAGVLVSPFTWSVDHKPAAPASANTTTHWRRSTRTHLRFGEVDPQQDANITASQTLARLGVVRKLDPGEHTLKIELQGPRAHDEHYSMEIELMAARRITDDRE